MDGAVCTFREDRVPFRVVDGVVDGYGYDDKQQAPRYRVVEDAKRMKIGHLPRWKRDCERRLVQREWTTVPGQPDNACCAFGGQDA